MDSLKTKEACAFCQKTETSHRWTAQVGKQIAREESIDAPPWSIRRTITTNTSYLVCNVEVSYCERCAAAAHAPGLLRHVGLGLLAVLVVQAAGVLLAVLWPGLMPSVGAASLEQWANWMPTVALPAGCIAVVLGVLRGRRLRAQWPAGVPLPKVPAERNGGWSRRYRLLASANVHSAQGYTKLLEVFRDGQRVYADWTVQAHEDRGERERRLTDSLRTALAPQLTNVEPATLSRSAGQARLVINGRFLDHPSAVRFVCDGAVDESMVATELTAHHDGTLLSAVVRISSLAPVGKRAVQVVTSRATSALSPGADLLVEP